MSPQPAIQQPTIQQPAPTAGYVAPPGTASPSEPEDSPESLVETPLDELVSQEQTAAPTLYPQGWSPGYRPQRQASGWRPMLLIGCLGVGGVLLVLLAVGGIAAYYFFPGFNHTAGYAQQSATATSPLAAFKAHQRHMVDRNYAAAYYFFDAPSREYLDGLAKRYGMRDGIELLENLFDYRSSVESSELDEKTKEALAEFAQQMQGMAERMMANMEFAEEINGDRGAVLMRLKGMPLSRSVRTEMVREDGAWRHPLSSAERSQIQRQVMSSFSGSQPG